MQTSYCRSQPGSVMTIKKSTDVRKTQPVSFVSLVSPETSETDETGETDETSESREKVDILNYLF